MHSRPKIMTQRDAAAYLTRLGHKIDESTLSRMGKYGNGPKFDRLGSTKVFFQSDLDLWHQNNPPTTKKENIKNKSQINGH